MPPKKKGRSQVTRETSSNDEGGKSSAPDSAASADDTEIQQTPKVTPSARKWTDEEELALLRCVIKWKPVGRFCSCPHKFVSLLNWLASGMHKNFRMIAIAEALQASGAAEATAPRLKPEHIWEKLGQLYDLETLDERVSQDRATAQVMQSKLDLDSTQEDDHGWSPQEDAIDEPFCDFDLPDAEFDERKFRRRLASEPPSSPPILPHQLAQRLEGPFEANRRHSTIDDSEGKSFDLTPYGRPSQLLKSQIRDHRRRLFQTEVADVDGQHVDAAGLILQAPDAPDGTRVGLRLRQMQVWRRKRRRPLMTTPWRWTRTPRPKSDVPPKTRGMQAVADVVGDISEVDFTRGHYSCPSIFV